MMLRWDGASSSGPSHGYRAAETYRVLPGRGRARFLLPGPRRAAVGALTGYNRLRAPGVRAARTLVAAGVAVGLARVTSGSLVVDVREDGTDPADHLLLSHLERVLGRPGLTAAVGVHRPDPNHKPTLQLVDRSGEAVGYAKVGWNGPTRALVRAEATALAARPGRPSSGASLGVPQLLWSGAWRDREVVVVAPLPAGVRRWAGHGPPSPDVLRSVVGPARTTTLRGSPWWLRLLGELDVPGADPGERDALGRLAAVCRLVEEQHGGTEVWVGRWHGDWVPWNLAQDRSGLHAFDWEHSSDGVPVGFDLLHWAFQVRVVAEGATAREGAEAVDEAAARAWPSLAPGQPTAVVADCYLLEMAARTLRLKRSGGSWNPRLHPGLLDVVEGRLRRKGGRSLVQPAP